MHAWSRCNAAEVLGAGVADDANTAPALGVGENHLVWAMNASRRTNQALAYHVLDGSKQT